MAHTVIPRLSVEDREKSLGWLALWWMMSFTLIGRGGGVGLPVDYAPEFERFIVDCYALDHKGRRRFPHVFLSRAKGSDKSGKGAAIAMFEGFGPCRFAGWAEGGETYTFLGQTYIYSPGEPMGRPVQNPEIICAATAEGQPLDLATPVATSDGWKTVGDLRIGDKVFASDGKPTPIVRMTEVFSDLPCYRVTFSDGESIVCSGSHMWTLERRNNHDGRHERVTVTTEQMSSDFWSSCRGHRYRLHVSSPFDLPQKELAVDPYFLGLWLGDGKKSSACIAYDMQDEADVNSILTPLLEEGEHLHFYKPVGGCGVVNVVRDSGRKNLNSLRSRLRDIGVLFNKHVPNEYLWASAEQRMSLLQGLMDSDGTIGADKGRAVFVNHDRRLIDGIEELLSGLGYKWCESYISSTDSWKVSFEPSSERPVFRLLRKVKRLRSSSRQKTSQYRHIVSVEAVETRPVRCIGIDTQDHLFAAGKKFVLTHNTGNVFDTIYYNCTQGPLSELAGYGMDAGKARIGLPEGGEIVPSTTGAASHDGGIETFAVVDETHLYNRPALRNMYNTIDRNLAKRRLDADPWVLETTTMYRPGEDSIAEGTYKYAQDIQEGKVKHFAGLLFDHRFAQLAPEEFGDEAKLRHALYEAYGSVAHSSDGKDYVFTPDGQMQALQSNGATVDGWTLATAEPGPTGDGFVDVDGVMQQIYQPSADINDSIRYFLNSLSSAEDAWLSETEVSSHTVLASEMQHAQRVGRIEDAWQQYVSPDDEITLGFDGSVSHDATALVGCRVRDGLVFLIKLAQRPDDVTAVNWTVDRDSFDGKTRWMFENYNVVACFADAAYFEAMIAGWEQDYPESMKVGPSKTPAMRFYTNTWHQSMFKGLQNMHTSFMYPMEHVPDTADPVRGNVMLLGDRRLVNHFRNARKRDKSYGYLIFKETPKSEKKIDAAMAGSLAYMARQKYLERDQEAPETVQQIPIRVR